MNLNYVFFRVYKRHLTNSHAQDGYAPIPGQPLPISLDKEQKANLTYGFIDWSESDHIMKYGNDWMK